MKLHSIALLAALVAAPCIYAQTPPAPSPAMQAARAAFRKACATDQQTLCGDKQGREVFQCMRANEDKLSPDCKDAMSKMRRPAPPSAPPPAQ